ncbi:MAG: hypothetical protein E6038_03010 [Clostridium perfringens]|nr:hypothetical protein [Clostridium perfringens]MDU5650082.1 hypothetical protein [Clostridium perfringens]
MANLSLTACSFHLKPRKSQKKPFYINREIKVEKDEEEIIFKNCIEVFKSFFDAYSDSISDDYRKKTFSCFFHENYKGETDEYIYMYTLIKSGNYGSTSEIKDIDTNEVVYEKKANESEEKPFYLFIVIPKDNDRVIVQKGMLLFQNIGPYGVKTITTQYMQKYFSENFGITINCRTIAPELFVRKILRKENISKLIMTRNHKSKDASDKLSSGYGVETRMLANLRFDEKLWGKISSKMNFFIKGKANLFEFEGFKYNDLRVEVNIGDKKRRINLNYIDNLSIIEDMPDSILGLDGHPIEELLVEHFKEVSNEYLSEMVLQIN